MKNKSIQSSKSATFARLALLSAFSIFALTSCYPSKPAEKTCKDHRLAYDIHNGEATLLAAEDKIPQARAEMFKVVKEVLGYPVCFPEPIYQQILAWYQTQPGITKYNTKES